MKAQKFKYEQSCSRCDGTAIDPDSPDCVCDCCVDGVEELELTEAEAVNYPDARRIVRGTE